MDCLDLHNHLVNKMEIQGILGDRCQPRALDSRELMGQLWNGPPPASC